MTFILMQMGKRLEKKVRPSPSANFLIMTIFAFPSLADPGFQNPDKVSDWLATAGICLGIVLLVFMVGAIYGVIDERKNKRYQAQEPERLKQHQARFHCHICGKPSPQPYQYWEQDGEDGQLYTSFLVTDYERPTGLVQCARCQEWTCPDADPPHMEHGICKNCLQNMDPGATG